MMDGLSEILIVVLIGYIVYNFIKNKKKPAEVEQENVNPDSEIVMVEEVENIKNQYEKVKIMTPSEKAFFVDLQRIAIEKGVNVFTKVRLSDIVNVKRGMTKSEFHSAFNVIKAKHIDFIFADNESNVICCIELDDPSHESWKAKKNDNVKNVILNAVGIPLIRAKSAQGLETTIDKIINSNGNGISEHPAT